MYVFVNACGRVLLRVMAFHFIITGKEMGSCVGRQGIHSLGMEFWVLYGVITIKIKFLPPLFGIFFLTKFGDCFVYLFLPFHLIVKPTHGHFQFIFINFFLNFLKYSYMFRSFDHHQGVFSSLLKSL